MEHLEHVCPVKHVLYRTACDNTTEIRYFPKLVDVHGIFESPSCPVN